MGHVKTSPAEKKTDNCDLVVLRYCYFRQTALQKRFSSPNFFKTGKELITHYKTEACQPPAAGIIWVGYNRHCKNTTRMTGRIYRKQWQLKSKKYGLMKPIPAVVAAFLTFYYLKGKKSRVS